MIDDASVTCPHCWETISLEIDLSVENQDYIEDCPVCCNPMRITCQVADGAVTDLQVEGTDE